MPERPELNLLQLRNQLIAHIIAKITQHTRYAMGDFDQIMRLVQTSLETDPNFYDTGTFQFIASNWSVIEQDFVSNSLEDGVLNASRHLTNGRQEIINLGIATPHELKCTINTSAIYELRAEVAAGTSIRFRVEVPLGSSHDVQPDIQQDPQGLAGQFYEKGIQQIHQPAKLSNTYPIIILKTSLEGPNGVSQDETFTLMLRDSYEGNPIDIRAFTLMLLGPAISYMAKLNNPTVTNWIRTGMKLSAPSTQILMLSMLDLSKSTRPLGDEGTEMKEYTNALLNRSWVDLNANHIAHELEVHKSLHINGPEAESIIRSLMQ